MKLVELSKISDHRGNFSFIEGENHVPFAIHRTFWIYDVPGGKAREAHAHRECHQFFVAAHGSFEVGFGDGVNKLTSTLSRPNFWLYIPPGVWLLSRVFRAIRSA